MYIVAGGITILLSVVVFLMLPGDPIHAKGFTSRERYIAIARLAENNAGIRNNQWKREQFIEALLDARFWLMFFIAFFSMVGNGAYSTVHALLLPSINS